MYTLQEISPPEASQASFLQLNLPLNLTGRNTLVAIIDTGIDYLNEEFMDYEGNTRIEYIWDQTLDFIDSPNRIKVPFGVTYSKEDIQEAINLSKSGGDPYSIVPSKDEIGHGTEMTGIIGSTGKNPLLRGVVPNCKFVVVKLIEDYGFQKQFNIKIPTFN
ncbi:S8 family serine peptidase, partial [Clostridium perfringens]|nr:S8 family serine peptidase [Clostridium perfringens]